MRIKNIAYTVVLSIMCFICLGSLFSLARWKFNGQTMDIWGIKPVIVLSGSMEPCIKVNSIVLARKTDKIRQGDILMFNQNNDSFIIHRYYGDNADGTIVTKGDNNSMIDYLPVKRENVYGKIICRLNFISPVISLIRRNI